ncbi:hypothetical protein D3C80_60540 [compost metagenome]
MNNLSTLETMITRDSAALRFVEQLDKNELSSLSGEIFAKFYWYKRNPQWFKKNTNRQFARLRWIWRIIKKRLKSGRAKPELTVHGSEMERFKHFGGDAWTFFSQHLRGGWEIVAVPSPYSGFWINEPELKLCTYCEGDAVMMTAPNVMAFDRDCIRLCQWYENN